MTSHSLARLAVPVLFTACAGLEIGRVALGHVWSGFTALDSNVVGIGMACLWLASAVIIAMGTRRALYVVFAGSFALFAYGITTRAGGSTLGLVYVAVAPLIVLLDRMALGPRLTWARHSGESVVPYRSRRAT